MAFDRIKTRFLLNFFYQRSNNSLPTAVIDLYCAVIGSRWKLACNSRRGNKTYCSCWTYTKSSFFL